jgi:hypothetical protein
MMKLKKLIYLGIVLLISCSDIIDTTQTEETLADGEGEMDSLEKATPRSCNQRWIPSSLLTDKQNSITYERPSRNCSNGAQPGSIEFGNYIREHFGHLMNLDVDGEGIQIYNCRSVRGGSSPSVHSEGRAVDIFIPMRNGTANNAKGDIIANWLIDNAKEIGVQYLIWDRSSWKASGSPAQKCYTGTHPHNDHIHVELTWKAARKQTPFFTQGIQDPVWVGGAVQPNNPQPNNPQPNNPQPSDPQPSDPQPSDPQPSDPQPSDPQPNVNSWIGDPCDSDLDCAFNADGVIGKCFMEHHPASGMGFCSIPCNGFCPDAVNEAITFCVPTQAMGLNLGGVCMSKSGATNDYCQRYPGFVATDVMRYIGNSNASSSSAEVCLPSNGTTGAGTGNGEGNGGVCSISDIPFGDHNQSCQGVSAETWRCACSQRLGTVVSQVCRNGVWINFETNPSNCDRCDGPYTSGCNN